MKNFENPSINKIFEHRKEFIPEVGEQLEKETKAEVEVGGERLKMDYRTIIIKEKERKETDPVVLLPGFGSGWEGISELGFSLAAEGRKIIMPSLPGYGNSDNPKKEYYDTGNFDNEAEVVGKFIEHLNLDGKKVHLIGHSMGSEILATLAEKYPDKVSSLVLLNPAGVEKESQTATTASKFVLSGVHASAEFGLRMAFSGEEDYEKGLKAHIPKTKSPFSGDRLSQRMAEGRKLSKGQLLEKLNNIKMPITYISGQLDTVYPPGDENNSNSQLARIIESVNDKTKLEKSVMIGLRHNTTIAPDEITAANIDHYLDKAEEKNKAEENE